MPRGLLAGLMVLAAAAALAGCRDGETVTVRNRSDRTVVVFEDGVPTELIAPGTTEEFEIGEFRGTLTYQLRYLCEEEVCDQEVIAERTFTWEEIKRAGGIELQVQ
jgi:hypothetical protein